MPPPEPAAGAPGSTAAALGDAAEQLGCALTTGQVDQLLRYRSLLTRWNRIHNLTAITDDGAVLTHHLLDCLAAVPSLDRHAGGRPLVILDVGSGAGLPSVVLAIARPGWRIIAVDAVAKKARFIQQVAIELGLPNLESLHTRAEVAPTVNADVAVSRALGSLADFTRWTRHHLAASGIWLAMKGKPPTDEIDALPADVLVFHVEPLKVPGLDAERCLVWMRPAP